MTQTETDLDARPFRLTALQLVALSELRRHGAPMAFPVGQGRYNQALLGIRHRARDVVDFSINGDGRPVWSILPRGVAMLGFAP